jgi:pilus assembly protein CpaD
MVTRIQKLHAGARRTGFAAMCLVALAGCKDTSELDAMYVPETHYERYPIEVAKGPVEVVIASRHGKISSKNRGLLMRLAQQAASNAATPVVIAGGRGSRIAQEAAAILVAGGVSHDRIHYRRGGGNVVVSYVRTYAVSPACGEWSDLTDTADNRPYNTLGCAQQHNIAAMVANPEDLILPETADPSDPMRRSVVIDKYREGDATASAEDSQAKAGVSEVAKQ